MTCDNNGWTPPPPVLFKLDPKKPVEQYAAYTVMQLHDAYMAGANIGTLPRPGSPEASAMIDSVLAEYEWPSNPKNAARAGFEAARRLLGVKS